MTATSKFGAAVFFSNEVYNVSAFTNADKAKNIRCAKCVKCSAVLYCC